ncbi:MAG: hypothetical protein PHU14_08070 [Methylovulum sp.]|nr:hypothetical protein [Methylovulum sp.]
MIIFTEKGDQLRGDLINKAVIRSSLVPVPMTLELEIRVDEDLARQVAEGKVLEAGGNRFYIIKTARAENRMAQGGRDFGGVKIIALLDNCHTVAFVRDTALIRSSTTLGAVYKAAGATFSQFGGDVPVARFACLKGEAPSFQIAKVMQEEGGVVQWKNGKMQFIRLPDLFSKQSPVITLPDNASDNVASNFLERHGAPRFFSANSDGKLVDGNTQKARTAVYAPFKTAQQLQNMTRYLVHRKRVKRALDIRLAAGDVVDVSGASPLVIITVAHVFAGGAEGAGNQYSILWLGSINQ